MTTSRYQLLLNKALATTFFFIGIYSILSLIDYHWDIQRALKFIFFFQNDEIYAGTLLKGLVQTLNISVVSIILAIIVGFLAAFASLSPFNSIKMLYKIYILSIRNSPLITQILINYFVIGNIFNINGFWIAIFTLALFEGSYIAEIVKGSLLSIDKQQWLTGYSLGMNSYQILINIILPQAYPIILPALGNILISTVKDSSLLSIISIYELTFEAQKAVSETFMTFEIWFMVAFLYFLVNIIIGFIMSIFEKHLSRWNV